jgi:hypothetical protein
LIGAVAGVFQRFDNAQTAIFKADFPVACQFAVERVVFAQNCYR